MPEPARRRRTLLGVLVAVCLLLMTLDARQGPDGPLGRAQAHAVAAFAPLVGAVDPITGPVRSLGAEAAALGRLRTEHAALQAEHARARARAALRADLERENALLRDALGMRERLDLATAAGRVVGRAPGTSGWTVLVDVGARDGVAPDMAVVAADGLLGKVVAVADGSAQVELAVAPDAGYAVRVAETGQQGLVTGRGDRPLELVLIDGSDAAVPAGSTLVTRAFPGSSIPDGIPVGTVVPLPRVGAEPPAHEVAVAADPDRAEVVLVVLEGPALPDGPGPEEG